MALNINALQQAEKKANSGNFEKDDTLFMKTSEIGEDTIIRLMPPSANMQGLPYFEKVVYWVNKKPLVSPETFGQQCPIKRFFLKMENEIKGRPENDELVKMYNMFSKKKKSNIMPVLHLEYVLGNGSEIKDVKVIHDKVRILDVGPMLNNAIIKVVLSPKLLRRTAQFEDGVCDRKHGFNICITRTGKGLETQYGALEDEQMEIDAKYYTNIPNVVDIVKSSCYTDEYILGYLNHVFYGEPMPSDDVKVSRFKDELDSNKHGETSASSSRNVVKDTPIEKSTQDPSKDINAELDDLDDLDF